MKLVEVQARAAPVRPSVEGLTERLRGRALGFDGGRGLGRGGRGAEGFGRNRGAADSLGALDVKMALGVVEGEVGPAGEVSADVVDADAEGVAGLGVGDLDPLTFFALENEHGKHFLLKFVILKGKFWSV